MPQIPLVASKIIRKTVNLDIPSRYNWVSCSMPALTARLWLASTAPAMYLVRRWRVVLAPVCWGWLFGGWVDAARSNQHFFLKYHIAVEDGHINSKFSHETLWFSIAMLNYQRVRYAMIILHPIGLGCSAEVYDPTVAWCSEAIQGRSGSLLEPAWVGTKKCWAQWLHPFHRLR